MLLWMQRTGRPLPVSARTLVFVRGGRPCWLTCVCAADMVHRLSDKAQFITTTFRPELLESADKVYAITYR